MADAVMTDRELLELAAKAAGIDARWHNGKFWVGEHYSGREYNPLTDDGDALRLAVKLRMAVLIGDGGFVSAESDAIQVYEDIDEQDQYAATRRAIVRAAAEIGKAMP